MLKTLARILLCTSIAAVVTHGQVRSRANVSTRITPSVVAIDGVFTYRYTIDVDASSRQVMDEFILEVGDMGDKHGGTIADILVHTAKRWVGYTDSAIADRVDSTSRGLVCFGIADSVKSIDDLYFPPASALRPSDTMTVSFQSRGIPRITRFWVRGWSPPITEREYDSLRASGLRARDILPPWYEDALVGHTIGPMVIAKTTSPIVILDSLISYKHQALTLGWITNQGIANSLDQKLDNAHKQLERGNNKAAKNILEAFLNEVEAQKDKHLTSEAYALLKYNAEYLISKL